MIGIDQNDLGPAMRELTLPQQAFVMAYAENGGINAAEAAKRAGYGINGETQANAANRLLKRPDILSALREVADSRLKSGAILAASVLVEILQDKFSKDRYKAAIEVLNRAGLVVEGVSRVIVEDHRTPEEVERRVRDLAERIGIDPDRLLGRSILENVDYTVVDDIEGTTKNIHDAGDKWEDEQQEFDDMLERSK